MSQFRKKPVVIEAAQIPFDYATNHGGSSREFWERDLPAFIEYGRLAGTPVLPMPDDIVIQTLEHKTGEGFHASPGDWLICGVNGEVYACKPAIFAATYEPADTPSDFQVGFKAGLREGPSAAPREATTPRGET
jgi:hypothetical protein